MSIETPNGVEFSAAAKLYLCSSRFIKQAGMLAGYPSPTGQKVHVGILGKGVVLVTLDWLEQNSYATIWTSEQKALLGKRQIVMVRAAYSDAPGFTGRFLKATHWQDASVIDIMGHLLPMDQSPLIPMLDNLAYEFVEAGILTRGGYGAHGNVWNADWLDYLVEALSPEVYESYNHALLRADRTIAEINLSVAVTLATPQDHDSIDDD
ncbi:MAG: hypothetical protein Q7J82_07345 [Coriobacteriia bacterium]|nr:hypothetical protein [Coriobacteriia bacterium]